MPSDVESRAASVRDFQLLLDARDRVRPAALICAAARVADAAMWSERAANEDEPPALR